MKKSIFISYCLMLAINFLSIAILFFAGNAQAEDAQDKEKWIATGKDASCITSCPTCTIYTHPIKACRDAMLLEYKTQHQQLVKQLKNKVNTAIPLSQVPQVPWLIKPQVRP